MTEFVSSSSVGRATCADSTALVMTTCAVGLEDLLAAELDALGVECRVLYPGFVTSAAPLAPSEMIKIAARSRLAHGTGWLICAMEHVPADLEAISELVAKVETSSPLLLPHNSYGVRAQRKGLHPFNSVALASALARGLGRSWGCAGAAGLKASLKDPDFYVEALLDGDFLVVSAMMTGASGAQRPAPVFRHQAALDPTLAAAMLMLAPWQECQTLLDPMCGSGTILCEAAMMRRGISPLACTSHNLPLTRQIWFDEEMADHFDRLRQAVACAPADRPRLLGADLLAEMITGAHSNLTQLGLAADVQLKVGDGADLAVIDAGEVDTIIVNPPYGVRVLDPRRSDELSRRFARACHSKAVRRIMAISPRKGPLSRAFLDAGYRVADMRQVLFGEMLAFLFRFEISRSP